jgi:hypothetical protein
LIHSFGIFLFVGESKSLPILVSFVDSLRQHQRIELTRTFGAAFTYLSPDRGSDIVLAPGRSLVNPFSNVPRAGKLAFHLQNEERPALFFIPNISSWERVIDSIPFSPFLPIIRNVAWEAIFHALYNSDIRSL